MDVVNKESMDEYFSLLHDTLSPHGLLKKPSQIEIVGVPLTLWPPKAVSGKKKETMKLQSCSSCHKRWITIVASAVAASQTINSSNGHLQCCKPKIPHEPNEFYVLSIAFNTELFEGWLVEHFIESSLCPPFVPVTWWAQHSQPATSSTLCNEAW